MATETTTQLRTSHLAKQFNMKPQQLRRVLRSMPEYADGVHTNYRWAENDKSSIAKIAQAIKAAAEKREAAKVAAKAKLEKAKAEAAAQAKTDSK